MNEKENHLPNLSDKERAHALELAMKARKRRAVLKARMKSGELAFTDALNRVDGDGNGIVLKQVGHVVARDELTAREACGILRGIVELHKGVGRAMGGGRCARVSI